MRLLRIIFNVQYIMFSASLPGYTTSRTGLAL